jgi:AraC-like DNA-binding protein
MEVADRDPAARPGRHRFTTVDPERAEEALRESYRLDGGARIDRDTENFFFSHEVLAGRGFAATRFQASGPVEYWGPNNGLLAVKQVHAGRLSFVCAGEELLAGAGEVCLVPLYGAWRGRTEGVDLAPLLLDRDLVAAHAAAMSGIAPDALVFSGLEPISPAAVRFWTATVAYVHDHVLGDPALASAPLVVGEAFRLLASGLLTMFPNSALDAMNEQVQSGHGGPATVRRALEFMEMRADEDISIGDIAGAARIGARGLQAAFRQHRGETPLQYLRRLRMQRAHGDLQAGDPTRGDTVGVVAARWGFANAGRFAVEYRQTYGCSPSETLRH